MLITGNFRDFYNETALPALNAIVDTGQKKRTPMFTRIFQINPSTRGVEQFGQVSGIGRFAEIGEAGKITYDTPKQGFNSTFKHRKFGRAVPTTQVMIEDDQWNLIKRMHSDLGWSCTETREIDAAGTFNNAFDSAYPGPDGKSLCATDHPLYKIGGTQSNYMTAADLDTFTLQVAMTAQEKMKRPSGEFIHWGKPKLVIPPELRFTAHVLLHSKDDPSTAERATNPLAGAEDGMPSMMVWLYLTDPDAWFLVGEPESTGLIWYDRRKPYNKSWVDDETEVGVIGMRYRKSHGWHSYEGVVGNPGV